MARFGTCEPFRRERSRRNLAHPSLRWKKNPCTGYVTVPYAGLVARLCVCVVETVCSLLSYTQRDDRKVPSRRCVCEILTTSGKLSLSRLMHERMRHSSVLRASLTTPMKYEYVLAIIEYLIQIHILYASCEVILSQLCADN